MKFQDDISNMNTYIRTYIHTDMPKPICRPPHFFKVGGITMISWRHQYYIPSFVKIGPPVPEKIFEGFLPYMGVAAILVM